jgi:hypothetical protein
MAWNPSPSVAVARDAAKRLGEIDKATVDRCVIIYTNARGQMGAISYGQTPRLCADAKKLSDKLFGAAGNYFAEDQP